MNGLQLSCVCRIFLRKTGSTFPENALAEPLPRQLRALAERVEFGGRDVAAHRRHAAIGRGHDAFLGDVLEHGLDGGGDFVGGFDAVGRDIDHADRHVLALEQRHA